MSDEMPLTSSFQTANIAGHPGSTAAGLAAILASAAATFGSSGIPTNAFGWVAFAGTLLTGIAAAFAR